MHSPGPLNQKEMLLKETLLKVQSIKDQILIIDTDLKKLLQNKEGEEEEEKEEEYEEEEEEQEEEEEEEEYEDDSEDDDGEF
jgi:hypothetical protein